MSDLLVRDVFPRMLRHRQCGDPGGNGTDAETYAAVARKRRRSGRRDAFGFVDGVSGDARKAAQGPVPPDENADDENGGDGDG
jgi:hypothetical protein